MRRIAILFLSGALFYGCQTEPSGAELVRDMVVQTSYDPSANFNSYSTFSIQLDTVGQVYNAFPNDTIITGSYASSITSVIKNNIEKNGYVRVNLSQNPDLGVNVFVLRDLSISQYILYPNYYGGYYGGYYGYSGYYGYPYLSTYISSSATLVIEVVDLRNLDAQGKARVVWNTFIGDLITSVDRDTKTLEAVNQAFAQSPYFSKTIL